MSDEAVAETWASLTAVDPAEPTGNQGGQPAVTTDPPPANPSEAVAPASTDTTTEAKPVTTDPGKTDADAKPASTIDPAKVEPPESKAEGKDTVDPSAQATATDEEDETEEDKAEFAGLPEKAQAPARRYRKESRQYKAFQTAIGGEDFLEDAKLMVPAFHAKPAAEFDEILSARSPTQRNQLYSHMVYTAINGADRPAVIRILKESYESELAAALGQTDKGETARTPESQVEPAAPADFTRALATLDDLLADQYNTAEQTAALQAAKASLLEQSKTKTELDDLRKQVEAITEKGKTSQTQTAKEEEDALGGEFLGQVWAFADTRLDELGLSAAEGDSSEVVNYITEERKRIRELLPTRFEAHANAKELIGLLEEKFEKIPKLNPILKDAEKKAAWRFMPPIKACVDEILGKEVSSCLLAIEAMRSARQAPFNKDQRKEVVGHEAPGQHPAGVPAMVTGQGVDALWAPLTNPNKSDGIGA